MQIRNILYFGAVACACLALLVISNESCQYYDSGHYCNLADSFFTNGHFSFTTYSQGMYVRAYLYPFILACIMDGASRLSFVLPGIDWFVILRWILESLFFAFFFYHVFPSLFQKIAYQKMNMAPVVTGARLLFSAASILLWRGLLVYTLSDLPALCFMAFALNAFFEFIAAQNDERSTVSGNVWLCVQMGLGAAAAYYIRPIYMVCILFMCVIVLTSAVRKRQMANCLYLPIVLSSMLLLAVPQIQINHANYGTSSPLVQTQASHGGQSLYLMQLNWGIFIERFEGNLNTNTYPLVGVAFATPSAEKLLGYDYASGRTPFTSYGEYFSFCLKHLPSVTAIYLRHVFNGFDLVYGSIYAKNMYATRIWGQLANYTLLFLGGYQP